MHKHNLLRKVMVMMLSGHSGGEICQEEKPNRPEQKNENINFAIFKVLETQAKNKLSLELNYFVELQ